MIEPIAPFLLPATLPASWAYGAVVALRNHLYDRGTLKIYQLPAPVVSVGNLSVGGSGKTPLVAWLSRELISRGWPVAVLSRGYRRRAEDPFLLVSNGREILATADEAGDEPSELARAVPGLTVAVGADRFRTGLEVIRQLGPHLFLLDDGFQHRRLFRNIDIVCVDAAEPAESLRLLPAGRLRELLRGLRRATALVWTRWKRGLPSDRLSAEVLRRLGAETSVFRAVSEIDGFARLGTDGERLARNAWAEQPVGVLAAIARPKRLREDVEATGAKVVWFCTRRDHHRWDRAEVERLVEKARAAGARAVLTTGKDAVKLDPPPATTLPLYRVELAVRVIEDALFQSLLERLGSPRANR